VSSNPFTYGNPITDPQRFVGRTREIEQIFGRLRNEEFESSSLVGDRRIGKTSLLKYLANPGVRNLHGFRPENYSFVYADLQMVDQAMRPEQLWTRLLGLMRRECQDPDIAKALAALEANNQLDTFDLDDLFRKVDDKGQNVVFLLDEFEHVTTNVNFGPDFYYGLRSMMIQHKVALVTSSRLELIELCHSEAVKSSPFFNIFANIGLRLFSPADFQIMLSRLLTRTSVRFSQLEIDRVMDLAGLHPFFLQVACYLLYDAYQKGLGETARLKFLAENFRTEAIPHIVDYWDNSEDYEKITLTAVALLEQKGSVEEVSLRELQSLFSRSERWVERLQKRGLLMCRDDRYRLFSSVAGSWILSQILSELADAQSYHDWLEQNGSSLERTGSRHSRLLREILPKISPRYRNLIITWASDPQAFVTMVGLLKNILNLVI
jgi:conflict system STAND superfamily ATPase